MPIYFDLHSPGDVPLSAIGQGIADARSGVQDEHHVRQVDYYCTVDSSIYCVLEAPSEEACRARHLQRGIPCAEVHLITDAEWNVPLTAETRQELNRAIERDWQARHPVV